MRGVAAALLVATVRGVVWGWWMRGVGGSTEWGDEAWSQGYAGVRVGRKWNGAVGIRSITSAMHC